MLRSPRTTPAPCPTGCTCRICTDDCAGWLADLRPSGDDPDPQAPRRNPWPYRKAPNG